MYFCISEIDDENDSSTPAKAPKQFQAGMSSRINCLMLYLLKLIYTDGSLKLSIFLECFLFVATTSPDENEVTLANEMVPERNAGNFEKNFHINNSECQFFKLGRRRRT